LHPLAKSSSGLSQTELSLPGNPSDFGKAEKNERKAQGMQSRVKK